jgi:hypothetical protein
MSLCPECDFGWSLCLGDPPEDRRQGRARTARQPHPGALEHRLCGHKATSHAVLEHLVEKTTGSKTTEKDDTPVAGTGVIRSDSHKVG